VNDTIKKYLLQSTMIAGLATAGFAAPAYAQTADEDFAVELLDDEIIEDEEEVIVVTGSRVKRDTFSSISPLQVITADTVIDSNLINTADIVKSQTVISGVQLDTNINSSFVTNGGPGASNVSLRGLGEDRTLVLVNGRRFAPAGVEGAPSLPDLNLIPSSMVERVETLLDGASSVYGSDAIAGVINLQLRDEFDGFRVDGSVTQPFESGGEARRVSALMGSTGENGKFVAAVEYRVQNALRFRDRDWQQADNGQYCSYDYEFDNTTDDKFRNCGGAIGSAEFRSFTSPFGDGAEAFGPTGFFGISNSRDPNYRSGTLEADDQFFNEQEALTAYVSADREVNLIGLEPSRLFFETSFSNVQTNVRNGFHGQLFPSVSPDNPTNPFFFTAVPVVFSPIKRSNIDVDVLQYRLTAGIDGDVSGLEGWSYEASAQYSRSIGDSIRPVVLEDRLALSLSTTNDDDGDGILTCGNNTVDLFGFLSESTCVPVNLFAASLYNGANPQFATEAERLYLEGERSVTTKVDQMVLSGFFTGPLFEMPTGGGEVQAVLGAEYRLDGLDSGTDTIASTGGAAGFFADRRSVGEVAQFEAFAELDIPILRGMTFAEDLSLNLSGRVVDNEFYSTEAVYAIKAGYSPFDWLSLKGTYGTSYRSPGVRELFLGGQSGFVGSNNDPCIVPIGARVDDDANPATDPVYDPTAETRNPQVLTNCLAEGVDPTALGLGGAASIEAFRSGNAGLSPETSDALTLGFTIEQPFTDKFDLLFSMSYFDITVDNAPAVPSAGFILSQCYNSTAFPSDPFCQRRLRDPNTGFLTEIDQTPFNLASFGATGFDFNLRAAADFDMFDREFTLTSDTVMTNQFEREQQTIADAPINEAAGDFGFPEWRGNTNWRLATGDVSMFYGLRYIGRQDDLNQQTGEIIVRNPDGRFAATGARTSSNETIQKLGNYFRHDISVRYDAGDSWGLVLGINNVFDRDPPILDQDVGATLIGNVPAGIGYDLRGRTAFMTASKTF